MRKSTKKKVIAARVMSAATVSRRLAEYNRWRRGQGKYAYTDDPLKYRSQPFSPAYLGRVIDRAVELLKGSKP